MGTSAQFLSQVIDQVEHATERGAVTAQPIFGEYCLCLGGRGIAIVYEDTVYIKRLPAIEKTMAASGGTTARPFAGAQPHWILNVAKGFSGPWHGHARRKYPIPRRARARVISALS